MYEGKKVQRKNIIKEDRLIQGPNYAHYKDNYLRQFPFMSRPSVYQFVIFIIIQCCRLNGNYYKRSVIYHFHRISFICSYFSSTTINWCLAGKPLEMNPRTSVCQYNVQSVRKKQLIN